MSTLLERYEPTFAGKPLGNKYNRLTALVLSQQ